jgi:hypothetical protein
MKLKPKARGAVAQALAAKFRYTDREWSAIWDVLGPAVSESSRRPPGRVEHGPTWEAKEIIAGIYEPQDHGTREGAAGETLEALSRETLEDWISGGFAQGYHNATDRCSDSAHIVMSAAKTIDQCDGLINLFRGTPFQEDKRIEWLASIKADSIRLKEFEEGLRRPPSNNRWPLTECWNAASHFWTEFAARKVDRTRDTLDYLVAVAAPFRGEVAVSRPAAIKYVRARKHNLSKALERPIG